VPCAVYIEICFYVPPGEKGLRSTDLKHKTGAIFQNIEDKIMKNRSYDNFRDLRYITEASPRVHKN
jgi:hypothetical protein